jgi:hypothetical protein
VASRLGNDNGPRQPRPPADDPEAGAIVIAALSHFATEPKTLARFFALTGLDAGMLREAAGTPSFTAGVLDFVLSEPRVLAAVAAAQETTPEAIAAARARLDRRDRAEDDWPPRPANDQSGTAADDDWPPRVADDWA